MHTFNHTNKLNSGSEPRWRTLQNVFGLNIFRGQSFCMFMWFLWFIDMWTLTFLLEEESFNPDSAQCGDEGCCDDLQRLQACTVRVDLTPALFHVQEDHLLVHLQGTLNTQAHTF